MKITTGLSPITGFNSIQRVLRQQRLSYGRFYSSPTTPLRTFSPHAYEKTSGELLASLPPLSVLPTRLLLRSYFITTILASPRILRFCLPVMKKIANSDSALLNPDKNLLLRILVRKFVYDHFTAGECEQEVRDTVREMKKLGFKGVILGYAKEVDVASGSNKTGSAMSSLVDPSEAFLHAWTEANLKTLSMIGEGDFLAIKFSGAGPSTLDALANQGVPPAKMWECMNKICNAAAKQKSRIWIDAEQQNLQGTIDRWTIDLMRKYNRENKALVYTTMQAYLKHTKQNILEHLKLAQQEGWVLGIKLVRGAYIATERRDLIHDTIEETHNVYDNISGSLLLQEYPGIPTGKPYPRVELFLATHNDESIKRGYAVQKSLLVAGKPTIELGFGQLQGMADEASCGLLQLCQAVQPGETIPSEVDLAPHAFKCLTWGSTQECLQFLLRRMKENKDALGRTEYWVAGFRQELLRRIKLFFWFV